MELFQQLAAVCFVLALVGLAAYWLKRGAPGAILISHRRGASAKRLELIQRIPLTAQHHLCLVRLDGKEWLVGVYPNGMTALSEPGAAAQATNSPDGKEQFR